MNLVGNVALALVPTIAKFARLTSLWQTAFAPVVFTKAILAVFAPIASMFVMRLPPFRTDVLGMRLIPFTLRCLKLLRTFTVPLRSSATNTRVTPAVLLVIHHRPTVEREMTMILTMIWLPYLLKIAIALFAAVESR